MTEIPHDLGAFDAISPGDDVAPMRLALAMGASVRTSTSPNPWVGAVVVAGNGEVVGTGATAPVGGSHAEVNALQQAGDAARGELFMSRSNRVAMWAALPHAPMQ